MNNMLAYCGLACDSCPIHLATFEKDKSRQQEMRVSIAGFISEHYQMSLKAEDITDCDGCGANTGRLFSQCRNCEIRKCAIHRDIESCYSAVTLERRLILRSCADNPAFLRK